MAPTDVANTSFLLSTLFKVIGPGKTTFNVHGELLAKKSKVLAKDVNGTMRENETKTIKIEVVDDDIDDDTVMRFLEYVYTGDYPVPDPIVLQKPSDSTEVTEVFCSNEAVQQEAGQDSMLDEQWDSEHWGSRRAKRKKKQVKNRWHTSAPPPPRPFSPPRSPSIYLSQLNNGWPQMCTIPEFRPVEPYQIGPLISNEAITSRTIVWEAFCSSAQIPPPEAWLPPTNNDQREDFTPLFLCHARLYKLSDRYDCPELMELSLRRLHVTLSQYQFHQERASAVVDLIRYAYQHTMEFEEGYDKLRLLVVDYTTCYIRQLSREQSFLELMKEPGSLASDVLVKTLDLVQ